MPPKKNGKTPPGKKGDKSPKGAEPMGARSRSASPADRFHVQDVSQPQRPRSNSPQRSGPPPPQQPRSRSPQRRGPPRSRSNSRDRVEQAVVSPRRRRASPQRINSPDRVVLSPAAAAADAHVKKFIAGVIEEAQLQGRGASVIEGPRQGRAAAFCGGGGGAEVIKNQVNDLRQIVVSSRDDEFKKQRAALVDGFALLLPMEQRKSEVVARAARSGLKPLVETFSVSIRPLTTQSLHDIPVDEFEQMMGRSAFNKMTGITKKDKQTEFITCMDLLIQEAIINQISLTDAIVTSISQLIWNNSLSRVGFGLVGTYISIILARDSLLLFANSVLSTISLRHLTLDQFTLYCAYAYNECTSENLINLLVYLGAGSTDAANEYLKTLGNFINVQVQYLVMVIYLLGLQTFSGQRPISPNIQRLLDALADRGARPAAGAHGAGRPGIPNSRDVAGANLQRGLAAVDPAAAAAAAAPAAPAAPANPAAAARGGGPIWNGTVEAFNLVKEGITSFFMRGFNFTASTVTNVFTLYAARGPAGQGFFVHLNNALQALSNTGGRAIQARAGFVNQNPDEETNKLIAALMEISIDRETTPSQLEAALGLFSQRISENMLSILREGVRGDRVAFTQREWSFLDQRRFDSLKTVFINTAPGGGGGVNMERFQSFCQNMPLFTSAVTTERVAARIGLRPEIPDSQEVGPAGEDSMARMDAVILSEDPVTTELLNGVKDRLRNFGGRYMGAVGQMANAAGVSAEPPADSNEIIRRMNARNQLVRYQRTIQNAIDMYLEEELRAERINQDQRSIIHADLNRRVNALNMAGIHEYIIGQNPRSGVPQTFRGSLRRFFNSPIPAEVQNVRDTVKNAIIRGAGRLTATLYDAVLYSGVATADLARDCMNRIRNGIFRPAHAVAQVQPGEAPAPGPEALLGRIDNQLDEVVAAPEEDVEDGNMQEDNDAGNLGRFGRQGGKSRSFKRSVSKRTRRKGQKLMKIKSRRYVRRRRQTIRRKN